MHWLKKSQVIVVCILFQLECKVSEKKNGLKVITEDADDTSIWTQVLGWKELL